MIRPLRRCANLLLLCGVALAASTPEAAAARTLEGVRFPDRLAISGHTLELHGAAPLRYGGFLRAYVAGLYLPPETPSDKALADVPRRLEIEYFWSIPASGFAWATLDGVERNVDAETWHGLRPALERFTSLYADVEPGDRYQLTYLPGTGTELALNGRTLGRVEGADLARALFSIWLGPVPFDADLKAALLDLEQEQE